MNDNLIEGAISEVEKELPSEKHGYSGHPQRPIQPLEEPKIHEIRISEQQLRVISDALSKSDADEVDEFGDSVRETLIDMIDRLLKDKDFTGLSSFVM